MLQNLEGQSKSALKFSKKKSERDIVVGTSVMLFRMKNWIEGTSFVISLQQITYGSLDKKYC